MNLPDRVFWVITDSQSQKSLDLDAKLLAGSVHIADSVSEMAKKMHVSAKVLQETLDRYNRFVEQGEDKDFGKKIPRKLKNRLFISEESSLIFTTAAVV